MDVSFKILFVVVLITVFHIAGQAKSCKMTTIRSCVKVQILKQILFNLVRLKLKFLLIILSPFFFIGYGILLLYRFTISKFAHHFDPKLGRMVSAMSSLFALDGNYCVTNIILHVAGEIDRMNCINAMENLMETTLTPNGKLLYPEIRQRIVTKFGYLFWKDLEHFQVESHVTNLYPANPEKPLNLQDIREATGKGRKIRMNSGRSPWHIYIVKNFSSERHPAVKSAIVLRLHHVMLDGYSIFNVFEKLVGHGSLSVLSMECREDRLQDMRQVKIFEVFKTLLKLFRMFFCVPYELVGQMLKNDKNEFSALDRKKNFKEPVRYYECEPIPMDELKKIKTFHGVSLNTLITSLVILGVKKNLKTKQEAKKIYMMFPLPVFNSSYKLRNNCSGGLMTFDMTHDDPFKLIQAVENESRSDFIYGFPEATMLFLQFFGSLVFLAPYFHNATISSTILHISFPVPIDTGYFSGFPIVDVTIGKMISKPYPIGTLCYSHNGMYKFKFVGDASVFNTQQDIENLGKAVHQEFLEFSQRVKEHLV